MDATIINVALPSIGRDFRAPVSGLQWTVDAYLLVVASLLMLSGSVGDRVGRRTVFQVGLAVFTLGSLACSLAPGPRLADRVPRAAGGRREHAQPGRDGDRHQRVHRPRRAGEGDRPVGLGVRPVARGRPGHRRRARRLGRLARRLLDQHPGRRRGHRADRPVRAGVAGRRASGGSTRSASCWSSLALGTLSYGIIEGPDLGWGSAPIIGCFAAAAAAGRPARRLVAARTRAADRPAVLPLAAVLRRGAHRDHRHVRVRRLPLPHHALPAGGPRVQRADRGAVPCPDGAGHGRAPRRCAAG